MSAPIKPLYGVHSSQEHRKEDFLRDIRPFHERFFAALTSRDGCSGAILFLCLASLWQPALFPFLTLASCLLFLIRKSVCCLDVLPMRTPRTWQGCDYADLTPQGIVAPRKVRGSFFLGNAMETSKELWIAKDDLLTHMLVLGTTGAGRTETLVSLSFNCLAQGSGLMYLDPKAAPKLAVQIYTMCRIMGRNDDFLLKRRGTMPPCLHAKRLPAVSQRLIMAGIDIDAAQVPAAVITHMLVLRWLYDRRAKTCTLNG